MVGWGVLGSWVARGRFGSCCLEGGDASRRHGYCGLVFLSDSHTRSAFGRALQQRSRPPKAPTCLSVCVGISFPSSVTPREIGELAGAVSVPGQSAGTGKPRNPKQSQDLSKFHGVLLRHPILHRLKGPSLDVRAWADVNGGGIFCQDGDTPEVGTRTCDGGVSVADARGSGCWIRRSPLFVVNILLR